MKNDETFALLNSIDKKVDVNGETLKNLSEDVKDMKQAVEKFSEFKIKSESDHAWTKKLMFGFGGLIVVNLLSGFGEGKTEVVKSLLAFFSSP